jgi:superfamily II DNA or RNA helicase
LETILPEFDYKSLTLEQLKWIYQDVHFKREPFWHQMVSLAFAEDKSRVCFWHGVGSGKTLAAYYAAQRKGCQNILVVCPKHSVSAWLRDIQWTDYTHTLISGETPERKARMASPVNVHIVPYFALKTVFASLKSVPGNTPVATGLSQEGAQGYLKKNKSYKVTKSPVGPEIWNVVKPKGRRWGIDKGELEKYQFDCLILDEVHRCSSVGATQSKICKELSQRVPNVIALTGTPVDRVLLEMFNIYLTVDLGATFGTNFWRFRLDHFVKYGFDYKIREGHKDIILQQAMWNTLSFSKEECTDLPECTQDIILLEPTSEFRKLEERIILQKSIGVARSKAVFPEKSVQAAKLKQLSGGFLYLPNDITYHLKENPKLEAVLDLLEGTGEKLIVWHRYTEAGDMLVRELKKLKQPFTQIRGGLKAEEVVEIQRTFQEDLSIQIMICQQNCNEGWDGFAAGVTVFWDPIISPRQREQCIGRMFRTGQMKKTLVYDLLLKNTVDEEVFFKHESRQKEIDVYMAYMQNFQERAKVE